MRNRYIPKYHDDSDYNTNAPSYYEDLARKQKLIKELSERIWKYDEILASKLLEINERLGYYLKEWNQNLDSFNDDVMNLLRNWVNDGTLADIINEEIFNTKADQVDLDLLEKEMKQLDFVEKLRPYGNYERITIRTLYNVQIMINLFSNDKQITHQFLKNNDDYMIHTRTWVSDEIDYDKQVAEYIPNSNVTLTDFTSPPSDISGFTTGTGKMRVRFDNPYSDGSLFVRLQHDDRGGVWEFTNDETGDVITISTWDPNSKYKDVEIFDNLPIGEQTVTATFIGDDPDHTPSNGAGNSRGWLASNNQKWFRINRLYPVVRMLDDELIKPPSNVEFAINFKPTLDSEYNFVPFHGVATAFENIPIKFFDGDKEIDIFDLGFHEIKDRLIIRQDIIARHPSTPNIDQMTIQTDHIFNLDGSIKVNGKLRTLKPTYFNNSYVIMPVARADMFNRVLTSFNNEYPNTSDQWLSEDKMTQLTKEGDRATSICFVSDAHPDLAIAYTTLNPEKTYRQHEPDKNTFEEMTYIQHRSADLVKVYYRLFDSNDNLKPANYKYNFSGEYIFSSQHDVSLLF